MHTALKPYFSDDNFLVNKKFTTDLLQEIIKWNITHDRPLSFNTQATVMIGAEDDLLKLLADARWCPLPQAPRTISKECLEEVNKGRMSLYNPYEVIPRISRYGIVPFSRNDRRIRS